jgi:hypothetical protein
MPKSFCIQIIDNATEIDIDASLYRLLHENYIYIDRLSSDKYLRNRQITFTQLRRLSRANGFSYALFFIKSAQLNNVIKTQNDILFESIDNKEIIAGTRNGLADIRAIRWIIADLVAKKAIYKKYGNKVKLNNIVKFLSSSSKSVSDQADYILKTITINRDDIWRMKNKKDTYKYLCGQLSKNNIHVSTEAMNCMPQNVPSDMDLSGVYIRDNYNPMILICNEISGHPDEGLGRKIYTLIFLLVSIFKGQSFAVSISKSDYTVNKAMSHSP